MKRRPTAMSARRGRVERTPVASVPSSDPSDVTRARPDVQELAPPQDPGRRALAFAGAAVVASFPGVCAGATDPGNLAGSGERSGPADVRARWILRRDDR